MYRWQKPPILPMAYASAHRASKRRCSSMERRSSRLSVPSDAPFGAALGAASASAGGSVTAAPPFAFFLAMSVVSMLGSGGLRGLHLLPGVVARADERR